MPRTVSAEEARALVSSALPGPWHINTEEEMYAGACGSINGPLVESDNGRYFVLTVVADDTYDEPTTALLAAAPELAYTVVQQEEQIAAAFDLHHAVTDDGEQWCNHDGFGWPCPTARALGVTA